jgi:hypothetical protein
MGIKAILIKKEFSGEENNRSEIYGQVNCQAFPEHGTTYFDLTEKPDSLILNRITHNT